MHPIILILLFDIIVVAPLTGWLASQKGRSPSAWFVAAAISGPVALLAVGFAPARWVVEESERRSRRCHRCDTLVSLTAIHCSSCGVELPPPPKPESRPKAESTPMPELQPKPEPTTSAQLRPRPESMPKPEPTTKPAAVATPQTALGPRQRSLAERPAATAGTPRGGRGVHRRGGAAESSGIVQSTGHDEPSDADSEPTGDDLSQRQAVENIASGVFAGGVSELGAGYRYLISTSTRMLYISGPIDVAPTRIVFQSPRSTVDASLFGGDLVIIAESPIGRKRQLVFRGIVGADAERVEALLARDNQPLAKQPRKTTKSAE